jgi:hypothetical protein
LHVIAITAHVADNLGINFRCSRENFLTTLLGQIWAIESPLPAIMLGLVIRKHNDYERVNEMVHAAIPLPLQPL